MFARSTDARRGTSRIDWERVLNDLTRVHVSTREVARHLGRSHTTVLQWGVTSVPKHHDGEALLALWCAQTTNGRESAPLVGQNRPRPALLNSAKEATS